MRLFIAEKPELARAIAEGLGGSINKRKGYMNVGDDVVTYCVGHLLELAAPHEYDPKYKKWDMNLLPMFFDWKLVPIERTKEQLDVVLDLISKADELVNAGDPDSEGQLLVDEVIEYSGSTAPVMRLLINDNTLAVVQKSLNNMKDNRDFYGLYRSAYARSVADWVYGLNLSRAYTISARDSSGSDMKLSVGRVQTPILGLVVRRDRANKGHHSTPYHLVTADFTHGQLKFTANLNPDKSARHDDKGRLIDTAYANKVVEDCKDSKADVIDVNSSEKTEKAPLPHNLLTLQAEANSKYGLKADQTLKITQSLREKHQLITYNRSDCQYLSDEQHQDAPDVLDAIAANLDFNQDRADSSVKGRAFNSSNVTAHHAIIPTTKKMDLSSLNKNEKLVYELIARCYLVQFMPPRSYTSESVTLIFTDGHSFSATSNITTDIGWKALYKSDESKKKDDDQVDNNVSLSSLSTGDQIDCVAATVKNKKTKPPALYTEASLLKDLTSVAKYVEDEKIRDLLIAKDADKKGEKGGIGTPATRSAIIEGLKKRGFLTDKGKNIVSTDTGKDFYDLLPPSATVPDMTALWSDKMSQIESGDLDHADFLDDIHGFVRKEIARIRTNPITIEDKNAVKCPSCKEGIMRKRKGKKGMFWGCSRYPDCKCALPDKKGTPDLKAFDKKPKVSDHKCPECGSGLVKRKGKKGFFWGCSSYPECKAVLKDAKGKPDYENYGKKPEISEHVCPACDTGRLIRREGKYGFFWGCSNYPKCKNMVKDKDGQPDL